MRWWETHSPQAWLRVQACLIVITSLLGLTASTAEGAAKESAVCVDQGIVSYEMYEQIREGMGGSDLQQLLGTRRMVERSRSGSFRTYSWVNEDGSNILVTLEGSGRDPEGVVRSKAQSGLVKRPYVTCRDFQRLFLGLDHAEILRQLTGRGVPQVTQLSPTDFLWTWTNPDGSYLKLLLQKATLVHKSQAGLQ